MGLPFEPGVKRPPGQPRQVEQQRDKAHHISELDDDVQQDEDQANEFLLMGLRLTDGVDLARFEALSGHSVAPDTLKNLSELGLLDQRGRKISVTEQGVSVLNGVLRELLAD